VSHFLSAEEAYGARAMERVYAFAKVRFERGASVAKSKLVLESSLPIIKDASTLVVDLPDRWNVVDPEGHVLKPPKGRKFVVTVESFDPYHGVAEVDDDRPGSPRGTTT
jgi:hypothetical protein